MRGSVTVPLGLRKFEMSRLGSHYSNLRPSSVGSIGIGQNRAVPPQRPGQANPSHLPSFPRLCISRTVKTIPPPSAAIANISIRHSCQLRFARRPKTKAAFAAAMIARKDPNSGCSLAVSVVPCKCCTEYLLSFCSDNSSDVLRALNGGKRFVKISCVYPSSAGPRSLRNK
jgi:hypothetical protein